MISLLVISKRAQRFDHGVLGFGLPRINHVVDFRYITKVRMAGSPFVVEIQQSCPFG